MLCVCGVPNEERQSSRPVESGKWREMDSEGPRGRKEGAGKNNGGGWIKGVPWMEIQHHSEISPVEVLLPKRPYHVISRFVSECFLDIDIDLFNACDRPTDAQPTRC